MTWKKLIPLNSGLFIGCVERMANAAGGKRVARMMAAKAAAQMVLKMNPIAFRMNRAKASKIVLGEFGVGVMNSYFHNWCDVLNVPMLCD